MRNKKCFKVFLSFFLVILLVGCNPKKAIQSKAKDFSVVALDKIKGKADKFYQKHKYVEVPWDILLTKEDKSKVSIDASEINQLDLKEEDTKTVLIEGQRRAKTLKEKYFDATTYSELVNNRDELAQLFNNEIGGDKVEPAYTKLLSSIYKEEFQYPYDLKLIGLSHEARQNEKSEVVWKYIYELSVQQDKEEFINYKITVTTDETLTSQEIKVSKGKEVANTTRSLAEDSYVGENLHEGYIKTFSAFAKKFNSKDSYLDNKQSHLSNMARNEMKEKDLEELFKMTRGEIENGALVSWSADDKDGKSKTVYRYIIPMGEEENFAYSFTYDRMSEEIIALEIKTVKK